MSKYEVIPHPTMKDGDPDYRNVVRIQQEPWTGVVVEYDTLKVDDKPDQNDEVHVSFNYNVLDACGFDAARLKEDPALFKFLGDVAMDIMYNVMLDAGDIIYDDGAEVIVTEV